MKSTTIDRLGAPSFRLTLSVACLAVAMAAPAALAVTLSTVPMNALPALEPVGDGAVSTIIRDHAGVTITVHTKNLDPGPHTLWAFVWNNPENCTGEGPVACSPMRDRPESVMFGAGSIVGASGKGNFGFRFNVGDSSRVIGGAVQAGLTDAIGAEIHVVIADHGEIIPGEIEQQLSRPGDSGCGGPCPLVQGVAHVPGAEDAVAMRLNSIQSLLERVAVRQGLRP